MNTWARRIAIPVDEIAGDPWAEINPKDAQRNSIEDLDWIWIESTAGKLKVRAVVLPGCAAGVVNLPYGVRALGRSGMERGLGPFELVVPERDPVSGLAYRFGTRVRIYRA